MVKRCKKIAKETPKKKKAKTSTLASDSQKGLNVGSDTAESLLLSPTNTQTASSYACSIYAGSSLHSSDAQSDSATILAYLKKIDTSNEALAIHVQDLETNRYSTSSSQLAPMQTGIFAMTHTSMGAQASTSASQLHQPGSQQAMPAMNSCTGGGGGGGGGLVGLRMLFNSSLMMG